MTRGLYQIAYCVCTLTLYRDRAVCRRTWCDYLDARGIAGVFFSAAVEQHRIEAELRQNRQDEAERLAIERERIRRRLRHKDDDDDDANILETLRLSKRRGKRDNDQEDEEEEELGYDDDDEDGADADEPEQKRSANSAAAPTPSESTSTTSASLSLLRRWFSQQSLRREDQLTRQQLLLLLSQLWQWHSEPFVASTTTTASQVPFSMGFVGYPNVGKSSTINALCGTKRVSVAATPGHTKHYQSLVVPLPDDVRQHLPSNYTQLGLCDCPGLVFPAMTTSRADLVLNGVLPVDQLRTWVQIVTPIQLMVARISTAQLYRCYGLVAPQPSLLTQQQHQPPLAQMLRARWTADALLNALAQLRGLHKDHGRPDQSRSARILLKDYFSGRLLYCHCPPELSAADRQRFYSSYCYDDGASAFAQAEDGPAAVSEIARSTALQQSQAKLNRLASKSAVLTLPGQLDEMGRPVDVPQKPSSKDIKRMKKAQRLGISSSNLGFSAAGKSADTASRFGVFNN